MMIYPVKFHNNDSIWVHPATSQAEARKLYKEKCAAFDEDPDAIHEPEMLDPVDFTLNKAGVLLAFKAPQVMIQKL